MNTDLISVVLCSFNGAAYIEDQLNSIRNQTHANLEIIVVDDCSTDNTLKILEDQARSDQRIRLVANEKNLGYNLNFSQACRLSTGSFIAIADQDDVWEAVKLEHLLAGIKKVPGTVLVHGISARFEDCGTYHLRSHRFVNYEVGKDVRNFYLSNFISGHNMLLSRDLLEKALPFPSATYYDWWIAAMAACEGNIDTVAEILVWHRMHESNATGAAKPRILLYKQVQTILPQLLAIPSMKEPDREFGQHLLQLYKTLEKKSFSWPLFFFLLRHARVLFAHKKRFFPWPSYIKHAFRGCRSSTLA